MEVSIIIVNYNTKQITLDCLQSIYAHTYGLKYEIVVVDNASVDGSQAAIQEAYPGVILVASEENIGFGRANNLGVENSCGKYLFLLNSDTLLFENSIKKMYDFFVINKNKLNLGVLGCLLIDNEHKINGYGGLFPSITEATKQHIKVLPFLRGFIKNTSLFSDNLNEEYFQIDYVIGADMFMESNLFKTHRGFDPDYFMYYEESDLQLRIVRNGLKNYIYTGTKIIHLEDGSGKIIQHYSNRKRIIVHTSKLIYFKKNFPKKYKWYKYLDLLMLQINRLNKKYTKSENSQYIKAIKKIY